MQQNRLAFDRLVAKPQRRGEVSPLARPVGLAPAPFILAPTDREVAEPQPHQAGIVVRFGTVRLDGDGGEKARQRLVERGSTHQRGALVDVQLHRSRRVGERAFIKRQRRLRTAEPRVKCRRIR